MGDNVTDTHKHTQPRQHAVWHRAGDPAQVADFARHFCSAAHCIDPSRRCTCRHPECLEQRGRKMGRHSINRESAARTAALAMRSSPLEIQAAGCTGSEPNSNELTNCEHAHLHWPEESVLETLTRPKRRCDLTYSVEVMATVKQLQIDGKVCHWPCVSLMRDTLGLDRRARANVRAVALKFNDACNDLITEVFTVHETHSLCAFTLGGSMCHGLLTASSAL